MLPESRKSSSDVERKVISEPPLGLLRRVISKVRFFPKSHDFFVHFQRSSENIVKGTELLCRMIAASKEERHQLVGQLKDYEHIGDAITHEVIDLLHQTFLTPFDRSDIHRLVVKMDDILDAAYYVGNRLTRYNVDEMPKEMSQLAEIVHKAAQELAKAVSELKNMKNSQGILNHCIEVNRLENMADERINEVIEELFNSKWDAIQIIKFKELLENLERAADKCEDVAEIIQNIVIRHV